MIDEAVVLVVGALTGGRGGSDEAGGMVPRVIPVCGQTAGSGVSMSGPYTRPLLSPSDPRGGGGHLTTGPGWPDLPGPMPDAACSDPVSGAPARCLT